MDRHAIADRVAATIDAQGAELVSLRGPDELLWQAGPAWPRHAPVLFPVVGRLAGDTLRHAGRAHRMTQHGFARDRRFTWVERTPTVARLELLDDADSRESYPFAFRLELSYAVAGETLTQSFAVTNTGDEVLPASFGAHPAFAWPLRPGVPKEAHRIVFAAPEPAPIRRVAGGLLQAHPVPSPVEGDTLALRPGLFADDALIWDAPASTSVRYTAPGAPAITVAWQGMSQLGIWSRPVAPDFVCIEPWCGLADPDGFDGDILDKPAIRRIAPGDTLHASLSITISSNSD